MREKDGERAVTRIMRAKLGDGERLDDLGIKGYQIIQKKDGFCFGMDAVLLSSFVKVKKNGNVLDLPGWKSRVRWPRWQQEVLH